MSNVRTVSDTKRDFYNYHTRPINSIYRRVVEELMVEMHLLAVNGDFKYDPIYALGVVASFNRFMQGYRPERDKESIFDALCQAVGSNPQQYQHDAEKLKAAVGRLSGKELVNWFSSPTPLEGSEDIHTTVAAIADNPKFKYSRLFAIGLYTLLEQADPELVKDAKQSTETLQKIGQTLHLPQEKLQKDLELYRSNLEKMAQAQIVLEDAIKADRKKREQREQEKNKATIPPSDSPESTTAS
ncbi:MAG: photosystem II biogenesis protein Psp29 [Coleofasciculus sp. G1-WW12-02]|uniref:photosystem II biogenesis protein Psp29 n=1 Tax=unclassified Coleofasciculus TaxID=2692782 RepID=UPI00330010FE